jgi:hypothetical protein
MMAMMPPRMPRLKLATSISKPALILPCNALSITLSRTAASGPMIIAPRNIGVSVPTITPMVAIAPITAPRRPCTMCPPV